MWLKMAAAMAAGCLSALIAGGASSADITVVSTAGPMPEIMGALVPPFQHLSGHNVTVKFQAAPATIKQLKEGADIDLVIAGSEVIDSLIKDGRVAAAASAKLML